MEDFLQHFFSNNITFLQRICSMYYCQLMIVLQTNLYTIIHSIKHQISIHNRVPKLIEENWHYDNSVEVLTKEHAFISSSIMYLILHE